MEWLPIARDFGVWPTLAIMVLIGVWRAVVWFGRNILLPWRDRHFAFLDHMEQAVKGQAVALDRLTGLYAEQHEEQKRHGSTLDALWQLHKGEAA